MPITLEDMVSRLRPTKTSLLLGAGASIPSGGPSGADLAKWLWAEIAKSPPKSDDLIETSSILERLYGRAELASAVKSRLHGLHPAGGMLVLPEIPWRSIYTTNFDRLVEKAFEARQRSLSVYRSNFDYASHENSNAPKLFKIHGCITQDHSFGHKAGMLLTSRDYEEHGKFRQAMFTSLAHNLIEGDVLIVGQSLEDRHLNDLIKEVLKAKTEGAPGNVFCLVFNQDDLRAPLLEDKGAKILFGSIDSLFNAIINGTQQSRVTEATAEDVLPLTLVTTSIDVEHQLTLAANAARMFNGAPATYADIAAGHTFERSDLLRIKTALQDPNKICATVIGAAGVGKSTLARQALHTLTQTGVLAWEHKSEFFFDKSAWLDTEKKLREKGHAGILFIDECTSILRHVSDLIEKLSLIENCALKIILCANSALWAPRIKSPKIFSNGVLIELSRLDTSEIHSLVNLAQHNTAVSALVDTSFKRLTRNEQIDALRRKCSADMFVCLKNIFSNEGLDTILLREYEDLHEDLQDYYRYISALEAIGIKVHRQLIVRMRGINAGQISKILEGLSGIIEEYDIAPRDGVYGWCTRHLVISRRIAEYKFSSVEELSALFENVIESINPVLQIELQSLRGICDSEYGIGRIADTKIRLRLYSKLLSVAPGERVPWHRLIREQIHDGQLEDAENTIRRAEELVGSDPPINRFKVMLMMSRAEKTTGISEKDRIALLRKAYETAVKNIDRFRSDKRSYSTLCDVGWKLAERGESEYLFREAIDRMKTAYEKLLDPEMITRIDYFESRLRRLRNAH